MSEQGCMPVGEWIDIYDDGTYEWKKIVVKAIGKTDSFGEDADGDDVVFPNDLKWRYPINHEQQKRDEIMEAWRAQGLDYSHDTEYSMVRAIQFIDMLIEKGFVEVEK